MGSKSSKRSPRSEVVDMTVTTQVTTEEETVTVVSDSEVLEKHTLLLKHERLTEDTQITYEGPLTKEQLQVNALPQDKLFLIFFPSQSNELAYLDTVRKTLSFQQEPSQENLSVLMNLQTISPTAVRNPQYRWRTVVLPEEYYSMTGATVIEGSRRVAFTSYPSARNIPLWVVDSRIEERFLLSFQQTDDMQVWSLNPIITGENDKQVVGASDEVFKARVYHVTSHDANTLPLDYVLPSIDGADP